MPTLIFPTVKLSVHPHFNILHFLKPQEQFPPPIHSYPACDSVDHPIFRSSHRSSFPSPFLEMISSSWFEKELFVSSLYKGPCTVSDLLGNIPIQLRWLTFGAVFFNPIRRWKSEILFQELLDMRGLAQLPIAVAWCHMGIRHIHTGAAHLIHSAGKAMALEWWMMSWMMSVITQLPGKT